MEGRNLVKQFLAFAMTCTLMASLAACRPFEADVHTFNVGAFVEEEGWYIGTIDVAWTGSSSKSVDITWEGNEGEVVVVPYAVESNTQVAGTLEVKIKETSQIQSVVFTLQKGNGKTLSAGVSVPALSPAAAMEATTKGGWVVSESIGRVGKFGWLFGSYVGDLSQIGYVEEEYFIEGIAQLYEAVGELSAMGSGNWTIQPGLIAPYKTRILVRRPVDNADFNGTVVCEWTNVSAGYEISLLGTQGIFEGGYAYVSISAQPVGIHGNPAGSGDRAELGLQQWDFERYHSLSVPGEGASYDIFTQCARAVGSEGPTTGVDPMGGLEVKKLIGVGASQSGSRIAGYINGVQPLEKVFDGMMPIVYGGAASDYLDEVAHGGSSSGSARTIFTRLRDDGSTKVFVIQSQTEAVYYTYVRQPDTDTFRSWEIAAAVHGGTYASRINNQIAARDGYFTGLHRMRASSSVNENSWTFAYEGALMQMQEWIYDRGQPPKFSPLEVADGKYVYGDDGIVQGGVRLPFVTVPTASYMIDQTFGLGGCTILYTPERLKTLYPTHEDYVAKVTDAAHQAAADGMIMPYLVNYFIEYAAAADIPVQQLPDAAQVGQ